VKESPFFRFLTTSFWGFPAVSIGAILTIVFINLSLLSCCWTSCFMRVLLQRQISNYYNDQLSKSNTPNEVVLRVKVAEYNHRVADAGRIMRKYVKHPESYEEEATIAYYRLKEITSEFENMSHQIHNKDLRRKTLICYKGMLKVNEGFAMLLKRDVNNLEVSQKYIEEGVKIIKESGLEPER